jgi:uncharacterized glyoxalase superfamily protein PhnB
MSADVTVLNQLNIVAEDFEAMLAFYRRLGLPIPEGASHDGIRHVEATLPGGLTLEFDNPALARMYNAAWRRPAGSGGIVIGFRVASREAVDRLYHELTAAGHEGRQQPYDTFWGARYAIVADPAGNDVGLMSEPEQDRKSWPPVPAPDT